MGLTLALAVGASTVTAAATAAVAQAEPQFRINGQPAGTKHEPVIESGHLLLSNKLLGQFNCRTVADASVRNESGKGFADIESFSTAGCEAAPSCPGAFLSAEGPPKKSQRGSSTLPWKGEAIEPSTELRKIRTHGISLTLVLPCIGAEITFEGTLEPRFLNGEVNGLSPSHLAFGRETGSLTTNSLPSGEEDNVLTIAGTSRGEPTISGEGANELIQLK
jgi:hypothetical protein